MSNIFLAPAIVRRILLNVLSILIMVLASCVILDSSFRPAIGVYDEGFALTNALRILNNETPHLHYWSAYPPGTAIITAFLFNLFEPSLMVARVVNAAWGLIFVAATYVIVLRLQSVTVATIASLLVALWFATALYPSYSGTSALALCMTTGAFFISASANTSRTLLFVASVVGGITVLFRHDFAFYLLFASSIAIIVDVHLFTISKVVRATSANSCSSATIFISLFILVSVSSILALLYWSNFENVFDQMILFPATGMREHRLLPVPGFFQFFQESKAHWLLAWSAPMALLIGSILSIRTGAWESSLRRRALLFSAMMSLLLILQSRNRFDLPHAAPSIIFVIVFICAACVRSEINNNNRWIRSAALGLMIGFMMYSLAHVWKFNGYYTDLSCAIPIHNIKCMAQRPDQNNVVEYIRANTTANDYVFVGNTRHDQIFINDASLYFLMQRRIPVRWNEMHPGVVTTHEVQEEIVKALKFHNVRYVVLVEMGRSKEPNKSATSSGVFTLDEYISENYRHEFSSGNYSIHKRISEERVVRF